MRQTFPYCPKWLSKHLKNGVNAYNKKKLIKKKLEVNQLAHNIFVRYNKSQLKCAKAENISTSGQMACYFNLADNDETKFANCLQF